MASKGRTHPSNTIDYESIGFDTFIQIISENNTRLSRTYGGVCDTSSSTKKLPLLLAGPALRERVAANTVAAARLVWDLRHNKMPTSARDVRAELMAIAETVNANLLPAGQFREWDLAGPRLGVPYQQLADAVDAFCTAIARRHGEVAADPVPLASWIEWELNGGSLHPFYDGCGRISRLAAALVFVRSDCLLPLYETPESYFAAGLAGRGSFTQYVRGRIRACHEWLARP